MRNNESGNYSIPPLLSPLPAYNCKVKREEETENVIWKWENNYLIITFVTVVCITVCTALYSAPQYRQ